MREGDFISFNGESVLHNGWIRNVVSQGFISSIMGDSITLNHGKCYHPNEGEMDIKPDLTFNLSDLIHHQPLQIGDEVNLVQIAERSFPDNKWFQGKITGSYNNREYIKVKNDSKEELFQVSKIAILR